MNIYTPYTYLITFLPTGQQYYGVRTKRGCNPTDLWNSYYTSSKVVRQLIAQHGCGAFTTQVRKTFTTREAALLWEHRVLRRLDAARTPHWLNKNNGDRKFFGGGVPKGFKHSEETKRLMSENSKGARNGKTGRPVSEETRQKLRTALTGTKPNISAESKARRVKVGDHNGMYGKKLHWYNNGTIQKQIEVSVSPPDGWVKGRLWSAGHRDKMLASRHPK